MIEERRREPRRPAEGVVKLTLSDGTTFTATLLDQSASGFRAQYSSAGVRSGTEVTVDTGSQTFQARVAWTVTVEGNNQSGFFKS
jgi:hypothetical protein